MPKRISSESQINSSGTVFFVLAAIISSYVVSLSFPALFGKSFIAVFLFALILSATRYLIRQLYTAGQSVFLFASAFLILPPVLTLTFGNNLGMAGLLVFLAATFIATIFEVIYELLKDVRPFSPLTRILLGADEKIDRRAGHLAAAHLSLNNFKGLIIGLAIIASYYALCFLLFRI